jgi:tripartite-type tricarboxylate transporter receptor subunit TctC
MPDIQQRLVSLGLTPLHGDPAEMSAAIQRDIAHWGEVVQARGAPAGVIA